MQEYQKKIQRYREEKKQLDMENTFYHQLTSVFITVKKVGDKEKKFCYLMATEDNVMKKREIMEGIKRC